MLISHSQWQCAFIWSTKASTNKPIHEPTFNPFLSSEPPKRKDHSNLRTLIAYPEDSLIANPKSTTKMSNQPEQQVPLQDFDDFLQNNPDFDFTDFDDLTTLETDNELHQTLDPESLTSISGFGAPQELFPIQPEPQIPQYPTPSISTGAHYHPQIGWYYPAPPPSQIPTHAMPYQPSMDMTPVSSVPVSQYTSGTSTPIPAVANPSRFEGTATSAPQAKRTRAPSKRKYGPSAFLDARAQGRNSVSNEDANFFSSNASRRDGRADPSAATLDMLFKRKTGRPDVVQACVCNDKGEERIKRPKNAFILYRLSRSGALVKKLGGFNNNQISKIAAQDWNNASAEEKAKFYKLAEEEKARHAQKYPNYKYKAGGGARAKFGSISCTCGAYEANISNFHAKTGGSADIVDSTEHDDDQDGSDAQGDDYVPPRQIRRIRRSPPARLANLPNKAPPNIDVASLGLPANQVAQAEQLLSGLKRKYELDNDGTVPEDAGLAKRRSPRSKRKSISYNEDDDEADDLDGLFDFDAAVKTPSSSHVDRSSDSPPAKNTRSRSRASIADDLIAENAPLEWTSPSDDEGDNIVVAMKPASRRTSSIGNGKSRKSPRRS